MYNDLLQAYDGVVDQYRQLEDKYYVLRDDKRAQRRIKVSGLNNWGSSRSTKVILR